MTSNSHEYWLSLKRCEPSKASVQVLQSAPAPNVASDESERFSPLYSLELLPSEYIGDDRSFYLSFFIHQRPAAAISKVRKDELKGLCCSLGLASIVMVDSDAKKCARLTELWRSGLVGWETWRVENGVLVESKHHLPAPQQVTKSYFALDASEVQDPDIEWIVLELQNNLKRFAALSAQYLPSNLPRCEIWRQSVQRIITEVIRASKEEPTPDTTSAIDLLRQQKKFHANTELLIHINSALVYAITQSFHGAIPIESTLPLISSHSLLGVGSAWVTLRNLCSFIESVFAKYPVPLVITSEFASLPWRDLPSHSSKPIVYETETIEPKRASDVRPKITSFSSRLGFGESDFTATCAAQALHAAASSRHNMMTMSHELLHAHVKALAIAVFARKAAGTDQSIEDGICHAHQEWIARREDRLAAESLRLIHTIRFSIVEFVGEYQFCLKRAEHIRATGKPPVESSNEAYVPRLSQDFRLAFRTSYRFLEEVLVHTLDFHYFYGAQADVYVDAIWSSWSTVPAVLSRLEWYILRTLGALATVIAPTDDNKTFCFEQALALLKRRLAHMAESQPHKGVANAAIKLMEDSRIRHWLMVMFIPTLRLADLASKLLVDSRIADALWGGDDAIDWNDDEQRMTYLFDDFTFEDRQIANPVAFLVDRLTRVLSVPSVETDESRKSAWINIVLADHDIPRVSPTARHEDA